MPGLLVAVLLISSLLLVHFSIRARPLPKDRPLDVDEGLPLPEAGQASTVFSLTALFGAYFGIALVLGLPALSGLAFGTVLGLFLIRYWVDRDKPKRFETFLFGLLKGNERNAVVYALVISFVQCAYATSELLLLREVARVALGMKAEQATLLAIGVGVIGYFYVLFGGYIAVFRTDVLQFLLVGVMAVVAAAFLITRPPPAGWTGRLLPRPGYWEMPFLGAGAGLYVYHFAIAAVMGLGLLASSPDSWKRVFMVSKRRSRPGVRFLTFVSVGMMPYLVLIPIVISVGPIPDGPVKKGLIFSPLLSGNLVFVAVTLGLVASFLSSFNSALLASVHVGLMLRRKKAGVESEASWFYWIMSAALLTIFLLFKGLTSLSNAYLVGNFLMGAYALIAGVHIGTRGSVARIREDRLLWVFVIGFSGWLIYFVSAGLPDVATTYQLNTVPGGVMLFFITALSCLFLTIGGRKNA